jgi:hypothetical protein
MKTLLTHGDLNFEIETRYTRFNGKLLDRYPEDVLYWGVQDDGLFIVWTGDSVGRTLYTYRFQRGRLVHKTVETLIGDANSRLTVKGNSFSVNIGKMTISSGRTT